MLQEASVALMLHVGALSLMYVGEAVRADAARVALVTPAHEASRYNSRPRDRALSGHEGHGRSPDIIKDERSTHIP